MKLFKFTPSARFLENGLFRFSQVALNDPHEALPEILIGKYSEEDILKAREKSIIRGYDALPDEQIIDIFLQKWPAGRMDERYFPGLWPLKEPRLSEIPFETAQEIS